MTAPLPILYRDDDVIVVDKPADLLVHRTAIDGDSEAALQRLRNQIGQWVYPVHRLDRPTSGALLFALHAESASRLSRAFREHAIAKHYLAVVRGWPAEHGVIERALKGDKNKPAQPSRTRFVRVATVELPVAVSRFPTARYALVMASPDTGRRHQLRRHLNGISHPVVGDTARGDRHHNRFFREHHACRRMLLHAWRLAFVHPTTGQAIAVHAEPPAAFGRLGASFGWSLDAATLEAARGAIPASDAQPDADDASTPGGASVQNQ